MQKLCILAVADSCEEFKDPSRLNLLGLFTVNYKDNLKTNDKYMEWIGSVFYNNGFNGEWGDKS